MADGKSILLIEDNDIVRRYYADYLRLIFPGSFVFEAASGQSGLDLYYWQTIDCVVLDLSLPDMSGFEVLAKLVPIGAQPLVPVVILTSIDSRSLLEVAKRKGAFVALQKDLTCGDELAKVVLRAMAAIPVQQKATSAPPKISISVEQPSISGEQPGHT
jgi:DNA-binding NarL/FixJ family response regulator